jgi:hypothetical protein
MSLLRIAMDVQVLATLQLQYLLRHLVASQETTPFVKAVQPHFVHPPGQSATNGAMEPPQNV